MLGSIGMPELIIIFVIALIIFGPRKLPELGRSLGKSLAEFKRASNELRSTLEEEIRLEEQQQQRTEAAKVATGPTVVAATASAEPVAQHEEIASSILNAEFIVIEDCGNMSPVEQPDQVSNSLLCWLGLRDKAQAARSRQQRINT